MWEYFILSLTPGVRKLINRWVSSHFGIISPYKPSLDILNTWHGNNRSARLVDLDASGQLHFFLAALFFWYSVDFSVFDYCLTNHKKSSQELKAVFNFRENSTLRV